MNKLIQTPKSFLSKENLLNIQSSQIDQKLLDQCIDDIKDQLDIKPPVKIFNKICYQQRDVGFFSDRSIGYHYANQLAKSKPMTLNLDLLVDLVNELFGSDFNGILINRYTGGDEYIGPHSDDEKNIDKSGVIAISYGSERIFRIRDKKTKQIVQDIPFKNLDIICMGGDFQKEFTHEIPPTKKDAKKDAKKEVGIRYSFTFRHHNV